MSTIYTAMVRKYYAGDQEVEELFLDAMNFEDALRLAHERIPPDEQARGYSISIKKQEVIR